MQKSAKHISKPSVKANKITNSNKKNIINPRTNLFVKQEGAKIHKVISDKIGLHGTVASEFRSASGKTTNTKELVVKMTDYLDYDSEGEPLRSYAQRLRQSIFSTDNQLSNPGRVFRKLTVHALPQAVNAGVAAKTFLFQGGVISRDKTGGGDRLVSTVNTVVKTDFNVQWVHVGTFNYLKMFKDSNYEPEIITLANRDYQDLLRYSIIDPDTGNPFGSENPVKVQLRFELTVAYPLAPSNEINVVDTGVDSWIASIPSSTTDSLTYTTISLQSLQDSR